MTIKSSRKRDIGSGSIKILATVASVSALVGGWAGFTLKNSSAADPEAPEDQIGEEPEIAANILELPPIPTLVPPPSRAASLNAFTYLPKSNLPVINPVDGLPVITPVPTSQPNGNKTISDKSSSEKSGGKSGKQPKDPVASTKSS